MDVKKISKKTLDNRTEPALKTTELLRTFTFRITESLLKEQMRFIKNESPDIVCLLDVTSKSFQIITEALTNYNAFQVFIEEGDESGTVILCSKDTSDISEDEPPYYFDYPGHSGRIIGTGIIHKKTGFSFNVLGITIDDIDKCTTVLKVVEKLDNYIIMGDFDIEKYQKDPLTAIMTDTWIKMGCPMRVKGDEGGNRLTRIYYHSKTILPKSMALIKTKSLNAMSTLNYGFLTEFSINKRRESSKVPWTWRLSKALN